MYSIEEKCNSGAAMKERPIIFNDEMVRAILDGRKTQTRRIVKNQKHPHGYWCKPDEVVSEFVGGTCAIRCPYGHLGDRLWVREAFGRKVRSVGGTPHESVAYRATEPDAAYCYDCNGSRLPMKWKPSIHMPRWASRILLEVTNVRVERLQSITEEGAEREGAPPAFTHPGITWVSSRPRYAWGFHKIWAEIYGQDSWEENPWVWVVEFKRIDGGAA